MRLQHANEWIGSEGSGGVIPRPLRGIEQWHPELPRIVGKVVDDAGAREDDQTDGRGPEQLVVALERCRLLVAVESGLNTI